WTEADDPPEAYGASSGACLCTSQCRSSVAIVLPTRWISTQSSCRSTVTPSPFRMSSNSASRSTSGMARALESTRLVIIDSSASSADASWMPGDVEGTDPAGRCGAFVITSLPGCEPTPAVTGAQPRKESISAWTGQPGRSDARAVLRAGVQDSVRYHGANCVTVAAT